MMRTTAGLHRHHAEGVNFIQRTVPSGFPSDDHPKALPAVQQGRALSTPETLLLREDVLLAIGREPRIDETHYG
jgi:hypothetical protein